MSLANLKYPVDVVMKNGRAAVMTGDPGSGMIAGWTADEKGRKVSVQWRRHNLSGLDDGYSVNIVVLDGVPTSIGDFLLMPAPQAPPLTTPKAELTIEEEEVTKEDDEDGEPGAEGSLGNRAPKEEPKVEPKAKPVVSKGPKPVSKKTVSPPKAPAKKLTKKTAKKGK